MYQCENQNITRVINRFSKTCFALVVTFQIAVFGMALSAEEPPPPQGFQSTGAVGRAIASGQVKLINPLRSTPESVKVTAGIEYGIAEKTSLKLDLYSPKDLKKPVPGLVFIHGGAWRSGRRNDYRFYCLEFAQRGFVVATISYRLIDTAPFPAAVEDAKCAVRWMRANAKELNIDPNRLAVIGGSAGGHLSMMVGYSSDVPQLEGTGGHKHVSSRVQAVVNLYGPTNLTTPFAINKKLIIDFLGNKTFAEIPDQYKLASPITHLTADDPPTLIFHGTIDDVVPVRQADILAAKLTEVGVPFRYDRLIGWPHTMDLSDKINRRCVALMLDFFDRYLIHN